MIQVGTGEAERALAFNQRDPGMMPQLFATFITDRFARGDEDF